MTYWNIMYNNYLNHNKYLDFSNVKSVNESCIIDYDSLENDCFSINELSKKICIIKLNGGLGTTMGCDRPKSLIEVKNNFTFLDITVNQIRQINKKYGINLKLILMNSFYTSGKTNDFVNKIDDIDITSYEQTRFLRIDKQSNKCFDGSKSEHYYPPGHGDLYQSLYENGILQKLISDGYEYLFVSNIDNLGATIDFRILNSVIKNKLDYCLEITNKTEHDVKGGTIIEYNNRHMIFEIAQCHPDNIEDFMNFKYFNTNNVWCNIKSVFDLVQNGKYLEDIDLIINPKKLSDGIECIQLEFAIGSLVKFFNKTKFIAVTRERFIPVKNLSDLMIVMSNLYILDNEYILKFIGKELPKISIVGINDLAEFIKCFSFDDINYIVNFISTNKGFLVDVTNQSGHYIKTLIYK